MQKHAASTYMAILSMAILLRTKSAQRAKSSGTKIGGQMATALYDTLSVAKDNGYQLPAEMMALATDVLPTNLIQKLGRPTPQQRDPA